MEWHNTTLEQCRPTELFKNIPRGTPENKKGNTNEKNAFISMVCTSIYELLGLFS
ncbi:MAG: hypothetical protein FWC18_01890 [Cystobacterineae bacterium]|nr:hypothetical protein [Cystobacterineae bacterium]